MNEQVIKQYEKMSDKNLKREFGFFLDYCKRHRMGVIGVTLQSFKKRAEQCGYILGMQPTVQEGIDVVYNDCINFENKPCVSIPFARHKSSIRGGKNPKKQLPNIPDIKAFGLSMSLKGWYLFFGDIKLQDLYDKLSSGCTIEELWNANGKSRTVSVEGKTVDLKTACDIVGIKYWTLMKSAKGLSGKQLQDCFDTLKDRCGSYIRKDGKGQYWCELSEEDMNALSEYAKSEGINTTEALHKLIASVTY